MTGITIHTYRFEAEVTKKIEFRYFPGFVLRNALLNAMEELYCTRYVAYRQKAGACSRCPWLSNCIYRALNLPVPDIPEKVVQPYLIDTNGIATNDIFPAGTRLAFRIGLFGSANQYADQWVESVRYLGSQMGIGPGSGRFELQKVTTPVNELPEYKPNNGNAVTLRFPYLYFFRDRHKIPRDGMPFGELMTKIHSRYAALCMVYGNGQPQPLPAAEAMPRPVESNFHITRLFYPPGGSKKHYDCFKGRLAYRGDLAHFDEILNLGSRIGIGQFTVAGLGRFCIFYDDHETGVTH